MKKICISIALIIVAFNFSGCTPVRALSVMNAAKPIMEGAIDSSIPFVKMDGHIIIVPVHINHSPKAYHFMLDTGALTLVSRQVANELALPNGVEIVARDTVSSEKKIELINLNSLRVGAMAVAECGVGIIDMSQDDSGFSTSSIKMDGILGSNFLKYFKVVIDYRKKILYLSRNSTKSVAGTGEYTFAFISKMKMGYVPVVKCRIDNEQEVHGIIDTGAPFVATLPLNLLKETKSYRTNQFVKAKGAIWDAAFKSSEGGYLLRLDKLGIGELELEKIPVITLPYRNIILGQKFLSRFLVTLNYPEGVMTLKPYEPLEFDTNIFSFGAVVRKQKNGETIIAGIWEGSSAEKIGADIGDRILSVNGKEINELTSIEVSNIYYNDAIKSIDVVFANEDGKHRVNVKKELLLPPME